MNADDSYPGLYEWLCDRIIDLQGVSTVTSVLDLGCGTGAWLRHLTGKGFRDLTGVDNGSETVFFGSSNISFSTADLNAAQLELGSRHVGVITAIEVVEYLSNPSRLF